jgi:hypothetical protein
VLEGKDFEHAKNMRHPVSRLSVVPVLITRTKLSRPLRRARFPVYVRVGQITTILHLTS